MSNLSKHVAISAILVGISLFGVARADVITGGPVRVTFSSSMTPKTLPRTGTKPISISVSASVSLAADRRPAALKRFVVAFNRHAEVTTRGLPTCSLKTLKALTSRRALSTCGDALVGTGHFSAHIDFPDQSPFPSVGRALVFNSNYKGRPALIAHVYGPKPIPTIEVLPLVFSRAKQGSFGLTLSAVMPLVGNEWGYVTGFDLTLERNYRYRGRSLSFLSAGCPAPAGVVVAPFKVARGTFFVAGGQKRTRVVSGACRVRPEPASGASR